MSAPASEEIRRLIHDLGRVDRSQRPHLIDALVRIGEPAVFPLCEALESEGFITRWGAVAALGRIRDPRALEPMLKLLRDRESTVREQAAAALGDLGDPRALPELIRAMRRGDAYTRPKAARALGKIGDLEAVPHLLKCVEGFFTGVQPPVVEALGDLGDARAVPVLCKLLKQFYLNSSAARSDQDFSLEAYTAITGALGKIGDVAAVEILCEGVSFELPEMRPLRLLALTQIGPPAIPRLIGVLAGKEPAAQMAQDALIRLGEASVRHLIGALEALPPEVRRRAAQALAAIGDTDAGPALVKALQDPVPAVRQTAALALGQLDFVEAIPALTAARQDPVPAVCVHAGVVLAQLQGPKPEDLPILLQALQQPEGELSRLAASLIGTLAQRDPVPALRAAVDILRKVLGTWRIEALPKPHRQVYLDALQKVRAATDDLTDLPLAAAAPHTNLSGLPLPAQSAALAPEGLPIPDAQMQNGRGG